MKNNQMVFILDKHKKPLGFISTKRAKQLLSNKRAIIHNLMPFVIRLKDKSIKECINFEYKIKLDIGSKYTGLAIVDYDNNVYFKAVIEHRGQQIVKALESRKANRRNRRNRKTRYRRCKYINHYLKKDSNYKASTNRKQGWLPPSIVSIEQNILNWVKKLSKWTNITGVVIENVNFDFQKLDNQDITGVEYQQGTLKGYTIKSYLLEKYGHTCQYCGGMSGDNKLQVEHIICKTNGGSNSIKNLTIACSTCNKEKDNLNLDTWLTILNLIKKPTKIESQRIKLITSFLKGKPLVAKNYGAYVNSYKDKLIKDVKKLSYITNIELSDGATTQYNRNLHKYKKTHYNDAICIGEIPTKFKDYTNQVLNIKAMGRGTRLKGKPNSCGILSKKNITRSKTNNGFQTGDLIKAIVPKGKKQGTYIGRVAIRHSGSFNITTKKGLIQGINYKYSKVLQKGNGYLYKIYKAI